MALEHVRVIDLAQLLAGPYACMLLGAMGADVIKVEPLSGEEGRIPGPPFINKTSTLFHCSNWHKRAVACNLKSAAGQEVLSRLLSSADVLVHNLRPKAAARLGLDEEALSVKYPKLIHCAITGFDPNGDYAETPGVDSILQARAGISSVNGESSGLPLKCGVPIVDMSTGMYAAVGILGAIVERGKTGRGRRVDLTMADSTIALQSMLFSAFFASAGDAPPGRGGNDSHIAVSNTFETSDSRIAISLISDRFWKALCRALGEPAWTKDAQFATVASRMENKTTLYAHIQNALHTKSSAEWKAVFDEVGIPCAPVQSYDEVLADEAFRHSRVWLRSNTGDAMGIDSPVPLREANARVRPPPAIGEHSREILRDIGYSDGEIAEFIASSVVRETPR